MSGDPTLLVLGVGGNVSQGILKALRLSRLPCRLVGACTTPDAMGLYTVDQAYLSPLAADEGFLAWLIGVCRRERVRGILSGVEPVLAVLARHADTIRAETGAVALVSAPEILAVGSDKLRTCHWLRDHGIAAPRSEPAEDHAAAVALGRRCGYPLIAKPRVGKGSAGVLRIPDEGALEAVRRRPGYILQERLGSASDEYTAATFSDRHGEVRGCIVIRRQLRAGTTCRAEAGEFPSVRREAVRIAEALRPLGPCNMQLRLRDGQPVCFEINIRFSGTAPIRARFGFNDVEAAVRHVVLDEEPRDLPRITQGMAIRYWNELYADRDAATALERAGTLERPTSRGRIEDYGMR